MKLSLKEFKELIKTIKVYNEREEEMCDFLHKYFMNGHSIISFTFSYADALVKSIAVNLANNTEDIKFIIDDINYFIYEGNFGKNNCEISSGNKSWKITSVKDFYKYLGEMYD